MVFTDNAGVVNHEVNVSGASDKINYYLSMGYYHQDGIVGGNYDRSNYSRLSLRSNTSYTLFDDTKAATIDNIIDERHKEFVGEGKRYWDLIRTGKAATTLVPDAYGYRTNTWTEKKKYLPIPLSEIDASHGTLTQNDY